MKKSIVLITAIVLISFCGYSQKISGGLIVSPLLSWSKPEGTYFAANDGVRFGYNVGLVGDLNMGDNFAFSTGLIYNSLASNVKYLDTISQFVANDVTYNSILPNSVITYKYQFIEIPLSLKGKTNEIGYITYFLKAGVSPMFRYKAKAEVENGTDDVVGGEIVPAFLMGVNIGGGIEYSLGGNTKLLVEAIYNSGLKDSENVEIGIATKKDEKISLNSFSLRVGILF